MKPSRPTCRRRPTRPMWEGKTWRSRTFVIPHPANLSSGPKPQLTSNCWAQRRQPSMASWRPPRNQVLLTLQCPWPWVAKTYQRPKERPGSRSTQCLPCVRINPAQVETHPSPDQPLKLQHRSPRLHSHPRGGNCWILRRLHLQSGA